MRQPPVAELSRLRFLAHPYAGDGTYKSPEGKSSPVRVVAQGKWESPDRYLRFELLAHVDDMPLIHHHVLITYSERLQAYKVWSFAQYLEDPVCLIGNFQHGSLVVYSEPSQTLIGYEQLRVTYTPNLIAGVRINTERFQPDSGYVPYFDMMLEPAE